jgi:hypothetical protein
VPAAKAERRLWVSKTVSGLFMIRRRRLLGQCSAILAAHSCAGAGSVVERGSVPSASGRFGLVK